MHIKSNKKTEEIIPASWPTHLLLTVLISILPLIGCFGQVEPQSKPLQEDAASSAIFFETASQLVQQLYGYMGFICDQQKSEKIKAIYRDKIMALFGYHLSRSVHQKNASDTLLILNVQAFLNQLQKSQLCACTIEKYDWVATGAIYPTPDKRYEAMLTQLIKLKPDAGSSRRPAWGYVYFLFSGLKKESEDQIHWELQIKNILWDFPWSD